MTKLSLKEKMLFVHSYIENEIDLTVLNVKSNVIFETTILKELEALLDLSKIENLINWHKSLNLPNVTVENLQEKIIETNTGKVLIGIRFLGMDINKPFVSVWSSFDIENDLENIIKNAKKEFAIFKPKFIRFWMKPNSILSNKYHQFKEQSFYAESIVNICNSKLPLNYETVSLEKINDLNFYTWYKELYDEFHKENPDLEFLVTTNNQEAFESCIKENLIYFIIHNNKKIGLIAANEDTFLGEKSIYIIEIVLQKEFKGKKLATAAQRKFIELVQKDYKYIWGQISAKNIPSSKNALRVGRKIISTEILLPI